MQDVENDGPNPFQFSHFYRCDLVLVFQVLHFSGLAFSVAPYTCMTMTLSRLLKFLIYCKRCIYVTSEVSYVAKLKRN